MNALRGSLSVIVVILALIGIGASATHYLYEPANKGFFEYPIIVALHVVLGGVYLLLAPFQFVKRIRSRHLNLHRRIGRFLVAIGFVVGATGLFIGLVIPFSGWIERVYIGIFGTLFLVAIVKGFLYIRAGNVALHREWMIRAFGVGLSIATMRLMFIPALVMITDPTDDQIVRLSAISFILAFVINTSLAEVWIRLTRRRRISVPHTTEEVLATRGAR